ncbi:MAG: hypothetical protein N5P05_000026 [Chroococcopsis gigantea SAG 12.99]|nr:hypothetical protein [Chroococcopsis gigantea SAG 12.99]
MSHLLTCAQSLINTILLLMPSSYQQKSLQTVIVLFLEATGRNVPQHATTVSASLSLSFSQSL